MIDLTMDEILEDLCYPGRPPGQWRLRAGDEDPAPTNGHNGSSLPLLAEITASAR